MDVSPQTAIDAAIAGNWKEAIKINLEIIKQNPKDVEALNRLARAYLETGLKTKARVTYENVLKLDKFNSIAAKNVALIKSSRLQHAKTLLHPASPPLFLEEPGVTKTITLIRLGDPKTVSSLHPGEPVSITCRGHAVSVISSSGAYLGRLPDDLSSRLRTFIKGGNRYEGWVKSVDPKSLKIFLRETYRHSKYKNTPSFPLTEKLTYAAFTPPELVHDEKPQVTTTEEETEFTSDYPEEERL
ncbi:hypothetical protein A2899_00460 [Candidatus Amesbacteria bacterium RIFCSPLOWO2_01_FULL_49_25]|nr:MAG: hypothetical protein A2899_00460 [Candidatus Amesbacteria bacterium RIFCSPLOWO2_01_FULL_49_25]